MKNSDLITPKKEKKKIIKINHTIVYEKKSKNDNKNIRKQLSYEKPNYVKILDDYICRNNIIIEPELAEKMLLQGIQIAKYLENNLINGHIFIGKNILYFIMNYTDNLEIIYINNICDIIINNKDYSITLIGDNNNRDDVKNTYIFNNINDMNYFIYGLIVIFYKNNGEYYDNNRYNKEKNKYENSDYNKVHNIKKSKSKYNTNNLNVTYIRYTIINNKKTYIKYHEKHIILRTNYIDINGSSDLGETDGKHFGVNIIDYIERDIQNEKPMKENTLSVMNSNSKYMNEVKYNIYNNLDCNNTNNISKYSEDNKIVFNQRDNKKLYNILNHYKNRENYVSEQFVI